MEENKGAEGKEGCCSQHKCCGCKALAAALLLLVGGIGGYAIGRHCGKVCPTSSAPQQQEQQEAPAAPAKKAPAKAPAKK
jgi:hypothetical protein